MSSTKRISGDYTLQSVNTTDKININSSVVTINGNLVVIGNTTQIETTNTSISDNIITLNANLTATTAPTLNAGITVNRGSSANVTLQWNESVQNWQLTNNGVTYSNIITVTTPGIVYLDSAPTLSANLNLNSHTLYNSTGNVQLTLTTASSGGSGVYVTNTQTANAELATKAKAVAYSIVFG
jgi:hypothetical protein